jgi:hypothetical protein
VLVNRKAVAAEIAYAIQHAKRTEFAVRFSSYVWTDLLELFDQIDQIEEQDLTIHALRGSIAVLTAELETAKKQIASLQDARVEEQRREVDRARRAQIPEIVRLLDAGADPIEVAERYGYDCGLAMADAICEKGRQDLVQQRARSVRA